MPMILREAKRDSCRLGSVAVVVEAFAVES
jgi:hypothetical protein